MSLVQKFQSFFKREVREPWKDIHAALFTKTAEEPFIFSTRAKTVSEISVFVALLFLFVFTSQWQISEGIARNRELECEDRVKTGLALTYFITLAVQFIIYLVFSARFKKVFPAEKINFVFFERKIPSSEEPENPEDEIPYTKWNLKTTIRAVRSLLRQVSAGEKNLFTVTKFLLSQDGKNFLAESCQRLHKLQLFDNRLARIDEGQFVRQVLLFLGVSCCSTASVAAAYAESENCSGKLLIVNFLDKFSITLLTILAIAAFAGLSEYAQIFCTFEEKNNLSDDECFLISLIAANTDEKFYGLAKSENSSYANIAQIGEKEVFIPMHMSLFVYKKARTIGDEPLRVYNQNANDCVGNYAMH